VNPRSIIASAALCCALPAAALLTRPDRDDAEYLELASRYPAAITLGAPGGEGVLLNPRWILTAAHRARALAAAKPAEVASVFVHPGWKGGADNDIGLVLLKREMPGVEPTPVYRFDDENGKTVVIAGHGGGRKRASINTVDRVTPLTFGLRIKPLDDASDLQGALTATETGAPAFIEAGGNIRVAGIAHGSADGWETYARVSAFNPWIEATMLEVARKEAEELMGAR
jgi:Trypsin